MIGRRITHRVRNLAEWRREEAVEKREEVGGGETTTSTRTIEIDGIQECQTPRSMTDEYDDHTKRNIFDVHGCTIKRHRE